MNYSEYECERCCGYGDKEMLLQIYFFFQYGCLVNEDIVDEVIWFGCEIIENCFCMFYYFFGVQFL